MTSNERNNSYRKGFPYLTEEDLHTTSAALTSYSADKAMQWADDHMLVQSTSAWKGSRQFTVLHERGENPERTVLVTGEFANEIKPTAVVRALAIRALVAPEASLLIQPNDVRGQNNMNYSLEEREKLKNGDASPLTDRLAAALDGSRNSYSLYAFGPSQGGVAALDFASKERPDAAVAVLEAPHVVERSRLKMAQDFLGCGSALKEVIAANFDDPTSPEALAAIKSASLVEMAKYGIKMATRANVALIGMLAGGDAKDQMEAVLQREGSIVHAWATGDSVSPAEANQAIRKELDHYPGYEGYEIEGDHSITNAAALDGALLRRAIELAR